MGLGFHWKRNKRRRNHDKMGAAYPPGRHRRSGSTRRPRRAGCAGNWRHQLKVGMKRPRVALARKLATVLYRMWVWTEPIPTSAMRRPQHKAKKFSAGPQGPAFRGSRRPWPSKAPQFKIGFFVDQGHFNILCPEGIPRRSAYALGPGIARRKGKAAPLGREGLRLRREHPSREPG